MSVGASNVDHNREGDLTMDWKIELLSVPVTDIDRAKDFYVNKLGFNADHDVPVNDNLRFVQLTPPGSACSIVLDVNMTTMAAGSQKGIQVVVDNADAAREQLLANGVTASEVQELPWGRFVFLDDPDGNRWALQQLPAR
jgi:catechol 2,3-dioxygenase-like lactoylglutathione lyase family enzyme